MFESINFPKELIPSDPRFGCGPSLIPESFLTALQKTGKDFLGTSHRKPPVKNLVGEINNYLKSYFQVPDNFLVVMGNGGATLVFDMVALTLVEKEVVHFTCGEFSEKWFESSAKVPWIKAHKKSVAYGEGIDIEKFNDADVVCGTLNETSTGVQLDKFPTAVLPHQILAIDATSGGGQVPWPVEKTDVFFFSPQKVFSSDGGLWVMIMSPKAQERALKICNDKSRYIPTMLNLKLAIENAKGNQTYNTPALTTLFFLREQIKAMSALGYKEVVKQAKDKANLLYGWASEKPYLSCYVEKESYRSIAVATIDVDPRVKVDELLAVLEKQKIVYGIDAYRKLGRNQFRIALFHNIKLQDLDKLTKLLSFAIEQAL